MNTIYRLFDYSISLKYVCDTFVSEQNNIEIDLFHRAIVGYMFTKHRKREQDDVV
jgi:hypothetical protein